MEKFNIDKRKPIDIIVNGENTNIKCGKDIDSKIVLQARYKYIVTDFVNGVDIYLDTITKQHYYI